MNLSETRSSAGTISMLEPVANTKERRDWHGIGSCACETHLPLHQTLSRELVRPEMFCEPYVMSVNNDN
eukprot:259849-Amphidinium_carterae.1